jgi:hypothetical protein
MHCLVVTALWVAALCCVVQEVSSVKALVVMLVDLLDVSGTLMGKVSARDQQQQQQQWQQQQQQWQQQWQ